MFIAPLLGEHVIDPTSPIKTCQKGKTGQGILYTAIAPKKTVKTKNQNKRKKQEGKGLKKKSTFRKPHGLIKTVYLPSDINSLHKQLFYLIAEYESNKSLR